MSIKSQIRINTYFVKQSFAYSMHTIFVQILNSFNLKQESVSVAISVGTSRWFISSYLNVSSVYLGWVRLGVACPCNYDNFAAPKRASVMIDRNQY